MVLEIKPRDFTNASAIKAFLTDQDGLRMVEDQGEMSIAVAEQVHAQYRLANVGAVRVWLQGIAALHDSHRE